MTDIAEIFRYFGFAEEDTRGVAETVAEMHCDAKALNPGIPGEPEMEYEGSIGRGRQLHRPGYYVSNPSAEIGTDIKILNRLMYFALGEKDAVDVEGAGDTLPATKVWYYDDSAGTFSSETADFNSVTANDVDVPGHAAGEVDDYLAIGYTTEFTSVTLNVGTVKTDTSTLVWEYWDGNSWEAISGVTDGTSGFTVSGSHAVVFTAPIDWGKKKLSTDTTALYYIRVRCSAFTSATAQGKITQGLIGLAPDTRTNVIYSTDSVLLPSFTSFMGVDIDEHIVSGCVMDKLELNVENDFITFKIDTKGQLPTTGALKSYAQLTINDDYPLAFYEVDLYLRPLGDVTAWGNTNKISSDVKKLTLTIENSISDGDGQRIGSRFPGYLPAGNRKIGLKFDYLYLTNEYIELLWGSSDGPQDRDGSTEVEMMIQIDAGMYGLAQVYLPRVIVSAASLESKGRDAIVQGVEVSAYQENVSFTGSGGATTVNTDALVTVTLNYPDTTGAIDIPTGM